MSTSRLELVTTDHGFRRKVGFVLADVEGHGLDPEIYDTLRTEEEQRAKVKAGYSQTMRSFHRKKGGDGLGRAADIADRVKGWNTSRRFWMILGASCEVHGVGWGGLFGLSRAQRRRLKVAFGELRAAGWPGRHRAYACALGWDVAHVEDRNQW